MNITHKKEIFAEDSVTPEQIIEFLLESRGVTDKETFMKPPSPLTFSLENFGLKKEGAVLIKKLIEIKEKNEMVVVYTDYDADGITGGAIMWETLHLLGFKVMPYVPDRHTEGYGFSNKGIDRVIEQYKPSLIISVDHGITAADEVTYAKSKGVSVVITDHHLKPEKLPDDAVAIIHTSELSGSGVSYMVAKEIYTYFGKDNEHLTEHFKTDYLILASIGTVADLVPIVGPARSIVSHGLKVFNRTKRKGLLRLMEEAGITGKLISPYEIGFIIAPRINAIGRLHHAIDALRLLCTTNSEKAAELAGKIGETNRERQDLVTLAVDEAKKMVIKQHGTDIPKLLILVSDHWNEGIIGLVSSRMTEEHFRPSIVLTKSDGHYKASARSIPTFHMTNFLRSLSDHLVDVGGHQAAAGFTIEAEKLEAFISTAQEKAKEIIKDEDLIRVIEADIKMPLALVTPSLVKALETMQPFGIGNPQPKFFSKGKLQTAKLIGKTSTHLQLSLSDQEMTLECIAFSKGKLFSSLSKNQEISIIYTPIIDEWNGRERLKGKVSDIILI